MSLDTRPRAMSPEDVQRIIDALKSEKGATISVQDPRVSSTQNWILAGVGSGIIAAGAWLISSVNDLNRTMTEVVTSNRYTQKQLEENTQDIKEITRRLSLLEKKP